MTANKTFLSGLFGKKRSGPAEDAPDNAARPPAETASEIAASTDGQADDAAVDKEEKPLKQGFFARLATGLTRSSQRLSEGVASIVAKRKLDDETLDELEEVLIAGDLGIAAAGRVREALARDRFNKEASEGEIRAALAEVVSKSLKDREAPLAIAPDRRPHVILMVGVNGAGKTTTIGKLAEKFRRDGLKVMLAAGDTFRAAAVEQLKVWGERTGAETISKETGADAAGLAYEALERAKRDAVDVLMIDTAGRLQNRKELMDELAKIVRVLKKLDPDAPHSTLLVLDATVGQNAISQADAFRAIAGVTGLVMTKLDGTARGGVLVALAEKHALPIHFIGVGEGVDDLQPFDAGGFGRALAGLSSPGKPG
ncbi:MAG: signal recognition particle-docking protein FtsY [Parvularculaceae bacterium]|nr:signal recognition particle-docking protein FtsY [Parvularculaceae bacterium]